MMINELAEKMHLVADYLDKYNPDYDPDIEDYAEEFLIALDMFMLEHNLNEG